MTLAADARGSFTGRDAELERLLAHWESVRAGDGPRVVVLLAEPGLGKTRLAQELYARLVAREQGGAPGYWPPTLGEDGDNLRVNPPLEACDQGAPLPFLWWGLRLTDPGGRNQVVSGALPGHVDGYLVPHLEPFHREQRRRQRLVKAARMGGALAADVVADAVPFLGLLKKVGEVGMELKGLHDEWRRDSAPLDAAATAGARRASLAEQVVADLRTLFGADAGVPAVLLLDDLQFSYADPGVTAFVAELSRALRSVPWPLMLVVTHWEREWLAAGAAADPEGPPPSPAGAELAALDAAARGVVDVIRLGPVADLAPLLRAALPGLTPAQARALLERAGGNPRLLEELLRFALTPRGRALFVGRDPAGELTEAGLEQLLSRGLDLADLVARRLEEAPEAVQRALALAALQGQEFEDWLVAAVAGALGADEPDAASRALLAAADPHAMTARLGAARSAFAQRVYHDVALEALPGWFDEGAAAAALAAVVKACMRGELAVPHDAASEAGLMRVAVALFEDDPEAGRYAAAALHRLVRDARRAGDVHASGALARRLAVVLERQGDDQDGDLTWLRTAQAALAEVGDTAARRPLLVRLIRLARDAYDDDVNEWSLALYLHALIDVASFHADRGDEGRATDTLYEAVRALAEADGLVAADDVGVLVAAVRVQEALASHLTARGEADDSASLREHVVALVERLAALDPGPARAVALAAARVELARSRMHAGRLDEASELVGSAVAELRARLGDGDDVAVELQLGIALDVAGHVARARGDADAALASYEASLAIARRHHDAAPGAPGVAEGLAESLTFVADQRARTGDLATAWELACEALELRRRLAVGGGSAVTWLGVSLYTAAALAARREETTLAHGLAREALEALRPLHGDGAAAGAGAAGVGAEAAPGAGGVVGSPGAGSIAGRWHLVRALTIAAQPVLRVEGPEAAAALLAEARELASGVPDAVRREFDALLEGLAGLEEHVRATVDPRRG